MICSISGRVADGAFAQLRHIDRRLTPAVQIEAGAQDFGFDDGPGGFLSAEIGARQEDLADEDRAGTRLVADIFDLLAEEGLRHIDHDAGAVAGLAVGIDRAAVEQGLQRLDGQIDDFALLRAVDGTDDADAAGRDFGFGIIGVAVDKALALILVVLVRIEGS